MRHLSSLNKIAALLLAVLAGCAADANRDTDTSQLGKVEMAVIATAGGHTYALSGSAVLSQAGEEVESFVIDESSAYVYSDYVPPGAYDVTLVWGGNLVRDGSAIVPATLTSTNPQTVTVNGGESAAVSFAFEVEGLPVEFVCSSSTCGRARIGISVTEL